jgi:ribosomal protein S18 acetylase RimI-like enzyme
MNKKDQVMQNYKIIEMKSLNDIIFSISFFKEIYHNSILAKVHNVKEYANKLFNNATVFAAVNESILGLIVFYANDLMTRTAYIAIIAVHPESQNSHIGFNLLDKCIEISKDNNMSSIKLEVKKQNENAISFYKKNGFDYCGEASQDSIFMSKEI